MTEAIEKPIKMASPPLSPVSVDNMKELVQLAELLLGPADVRKVIAGLEKAVSDSREVAEQTKAAQRDLAKLRKDLESERAKHEVTLDRERAEHELAMTCERAEVEAIKNAALELKAKAEADAAAAKWIKDELMRRVKPLSPVKGVELVMNAVGFDTDRGRNVELSRKYGNALIGSLRKAYGSFAPHCADYERLSDVLHKLDAASLSQLIRDHEAGKLERFCQQ